MASDRDAGISLIDNNVLDNGIYQSSLNIKPITDYVTSEKTYNVKCYIITTKPINKGDTIKLYYHPYKRIVPPFIESKFIKN